MSPNYRQRYLTEPLHVRLGCAGCHSIQISKRLFAVLLCLCFATSTNFVFAQDSDEIKAADTTSPRATLKSFIEACNELNDLIQADQVFNRNDPDHRVLSYRILDCLDQSELPAFASYQRAGEVAVCLKEILDREEFPEWEEIPDETDIAEPEDMKNFHIGASPVPA